MTARRALVIALALPYAIVLWPRWIVRDLIAGYRQSSPLARSIRQRWRKP